MARLTYPATFAGGDVEEAAGVKFDDPYRSLEREDEATREWQAAQNRLTDQYVKAWSHLSTLNEIVRHYFTERINVLPRFSGGNWFRAEQARGHAPARLVVSSALYGDGFEISIDSQGPTPAFVSWIAPSPDGARVAVGVCSDGSEHNRIHLIDVAQRAAMTGAPPQLLMDAWTGGVCWLTDSSGFFFLALEGEAHDFKQVLLFHDVKRCRQNTVSIPLPNPSSADYTLISMSRDGQYAVAHHGLFAPKPVAVLQTLPGATWRRFVTQATETVVGFVDAGRFVAMTNVGAPRGRIVAIPLDTQNPDDPEQWTQLVAESDFVMRSIVQVGRFIYCAGFVDTYSQVRIFDSTGCFVGVVPLPGRGAVTEPYFPLMSLIPRGHPDEYHFVFSTFTQSWGAYRHRPGEPAVECTRAPKVTLEGAVVEDHRATSTDGTLIPYHTVRLAATRDAPAPALLYAYGAFNFPLVPEYPGPMAAFIAAGGTYVHGHIRGGAELGTDWWRGGRMKNKQNCYEDLYAIAKDVVSRNLTRPGMLAMTGRSNGGLMAGVAVTQRPEQWKAVVLEVPVTDLIGMLRDSYGRYAVSREFADPSDPDDVRRLSTFSPYHLVSDQTMYPAIYINAGANDPRCPPWHARKFAARVQAATAGNSPVLLRIRENAGHGEANAKSTQLEQYVEWLAFLMMQLQMQPKN